MSSRKKPAISVRNPVAAADDFVARTGAKAAQTAKRSDVQTSGRPESSSTITRRDGRVVERTTIYFPPEVKEGLAVMAARTKRTESDIASEAVAALLGIPYGRS